MTIRDDDPAGGAAMRLARDGTDLFLRTVDRLRDEELDAPSLLPGWSRRHVIAHVGYNARGLCRLLTWARTGVETPAYASAEARAEEIESGAALDPATLRELCADSAAELERQWRELPREAWDAPIVVHGRTAAASSTIWRRTREVWLHAVDLDSDVSFADLPAGLVDDLLADVLGSWRERRAAEDVPDFVLVPDDRRSSRGPDAPGAIVLHGTAAALARWATGRGGDGLRSAEGPVPVAPRWL
jgi:maleylpyruvate isomerase